MGLEIKNGFYLSKMRLRAFSIILLLCFPVLGQNNLKLEVVIDDTFDQNQDTEVKIYDSLKGLLLTEEVGTPFELSISTYPTTLYFYVEGFPLKELTFENQKFNPVTISIGRTEQLNEVVLNAQKKKVFKLNRLSDYEGTSIFAGKKTEVIQVGQIPANIASNNARQIYAQISGLNIYQNDDAGLQLNIGGRGLDPNRTSNFNTRQNGYDISADVLGYPESYYSPPAEAIDEIQIVRGAASLQYGTQFGGLVNFKLVTPNENKTFELRTRNTVGSRHLYTHYTEIKGKVKNLSYLSYFNFKSGEGFRPHSHFDSRNYFTQLKYQIGPKTSIKGEITLLDYLSQQAGGLSDEMFKEDPFQSNRSRNWFALDWFLYQTVFQHSFSEASNFEFQFFGLNANRKAIGFRSNRVNQMDPLEERDLIEGNFNNYGFETRWLSQYSLWGKKVIFLIGNKWYAAQNDSRQGAGSDSIGPDFDFYNNTFPSYPFQSNYQYPNKNLAFFTEHIFYVHKKLSITPGVRFEWIDTKSDGNYRKIFFDAAGNVIQDQTIQENQNKKRNFFLLGLGVNYKFNKNIEMYLNASQNYRSVTFSDISIINPAYIIDPNITDENGITADLGLRGKIKNYLSFDTNFFYLLYKGRIGFTPKIDNYNRVKSQRGNVGDALILGVESITELNLEELIFNDSSQFDMSLFFNIASIHSEYIRSERPGIQGKKVEFIPTHNIKIGGKFGYKNIFLSVQLTKIGEQFTDATNANEGTLSGVIGKIPNYQVMDLIANFHFGSFKIETGINNLGNEIYFTRRATGYPGHGIIPSPPRNYFLTVQYRL